MRMKRLGFFLLCAAILLVFAGCAEKTPPLGDISSLVPDVPPNITMEVVPDTVTPTGLTLSMEIRNTELISGNLNDFHLEYFQDGQWYIIETGLFNNTTEAMIFSGGQRTFNIHWSQIYGTLPAGHYRFVKSFTTVVPDGDTGPSQSLHLTAEFDIP